MISACVHLRLPTGQGQVGSSRTQQGEIGGCQASYNQAEPCVQCKHKYSHCELKHLVSYGCGNDILSRISKVIIDTCEHCSKLLQKPCYASVGIPRFCFHPFLGHQRSNLPVFSIASKLHPSQRKVTKHTYGKARGYAPNMHNPSQPQLFCRKP